VKLRKLDEWNARRRALAALYQAGLAAVPDLTLPSSPAWAEPVWHLFVVRTRQRNALQQKLTEAGIGTLIHYPVPPHLSGAYANGKWERGAFPISEELADTVLSLPIGPHLRKQQAEFVVEAASQALKTRQTETAFA